MANAERQYRELALQCAAFALLVVTILLLWQHNWLLLAASLLECLFALALWHHRLDVASFLIIAILGSLAEIVFVRFGVWRYANPSILGVPLWFPFAFGTTGLIGQRLARTATAILDTKDRSAALR